MITYVHALEIDKDKCMGRRACLRVCPTDAIRVKDGKVSINPELCIDCGECITACPEGAIQARTDSWADTEKFKFKVAIVTPTLFGQFPMSITPIDIINGMHAIGFDAVYDLSIESEIYFRALQDYLREYKGPLPLISSMCPTVVRLIQVAYPNMVGQVTPLQPPREIAGREVKKYYSKKHGIDENEIGAIYITPCPAKMVSIRQPAEGTSSNLDLALGMRDIYNPLLAAITKHKKEHGDTAEILPDDRLNTSLYLSLAITGGLSRALRQKRYITVAQLPHIVQVIEDLEMGKIRNIDFLECFSCTGGCIGGALNVDNRFVVRAKLQKLVEVIDREERSVEDIVDERYEKGSYYLHQPLKPRKISTGTGSIIEQIERVKNREKFIKNLPGIDCGLCGAPSCAVFADDVAQRKSEPEECVLISPEKLKKLRDFYNILDNPDSD